MEKEIRNILRDPHELLLMPLCSTAAFLPAWEGEQQGHPLEVPSPRGALSVTALHLPLSQDT